MSTTRESGQRSLKPWMIGCAAALALVAGVHPALAADIIAVLSKDGRFDAFVKAIDAAGGAEQLRTAPGPFTVFAPTDKAFSRLPKSLLGSLMEPGHQDAMKQVVGLHIVEGGPYASTDIPVEMQPLTKGRLVATYADGRLTLRPAAANSSTNLAATETYRAGVSAQMISGDIKADNGIIHAVDAVLLPPDLGPLTPKAARQQTATAAIPPEIAASSDRTSSSPGPLVTATTTNTANDSSAPVPVATEATPLTAAKGSAAPSQQLPQTEQVAKTSGNAVVVNTPADQPDVVVTDAAPAKSASDALPAAGAGADKPSRPSVELARSLIPLSKLLGSPVRNPAGERLGSVQDVLLSLDTAKAAQIVLEIDGGFLNLFDRSVRVAINRITIDPVDGAVVVDPSILPAKR